MDKAASQHNGAPALMAAGLLAYLVETLLHEAVGHGGVCLASGPRFTMRAPHWMRCNDASVLLVAAAPAMNVLAACVFAAVLFTRCAGGGLGANITFIAVIGPGLVISNEMPPCHAKRTRK